MDKGTLVRTVSLILVWINVWLEKAGLNTLPLFSEEEIALALTTIVSVWAWFKNNYVTARGKKQKDALKKEGLTNAK